MLFMKWNRKLVIFGNFIHDVPQDSFFLALGTSSGKRDPEIVPKNHPEAIYYLKQTQNFGFEHEFLHERVMLTSS